MSVCSLPQPLPSVFLSGSFWGRVSDHLTNVCARKTVSFTSGSLPDEAAGQGRKALEHKSRLTVGGRAAEVQFGLKPSWSSKQCLMCLSGDPPPPNSLLVL